jgi:hypothetical protein
MRRFEQVPHDLVTDRDLSIGARALYPLLRQLAWDAGRREPEDAVPLPTVQEIAEAFGAAESTTRNYVAELRSRGWIETIRASRRRPSLWVIRDAPSTPDSGALDVRESAEKRAPSAPESGVPSYVVTDEVDTPLPDEPGERIADEAFTARFEVELALSAALNVTSDAMTSRERDQWRIAIGELVKAGATGEQVTARCAAYRSLGWKLTPMALVKHWSMLAADIATAKPSGFDVWLERAPDLFDLVTAHEIVSDTQGLDIAEYERRHKAVDERFNERAEDAA